MNKLLHFKKMHQSDGCLLLPNAWDLLSALILEQAGFKAIGTTSWGVANAMGFTDGEKISFEQLLTLAENMVATVNIPVTVDIESGYADNINIIADNVLKIAEIGAIGINIEDSSNDNSHLLEISKQGKILTKIRNRLDNNGYSDFFINARTDTYFLFDNPLEETISRSTAYINSGANGIFVPVLSNDDEINTLMLRLMLLLI
jgi:2-methylisocitrate lyase-like PEP mutase family enzyme